MQGSNGVGSPRGRFCFVHAAELRLDAMMRGVPDAPEPLRTAMRDAALAAWFGLVDVAIDRRAACVIVAGGLFAAEQPSLRARVALRDGLERLRAAAIPAFLALGADDAGAASLPAWVTAGATVFDEGVCTAHPVRCDGVELATVLGASCLRADPTRVPGVAGPATGPLIAVLPASLAPRALAASDIARQASIAYWALGGRADAHVDSPPWTASPGTPQGRGLEADELGPKGCLVVEVEDGAVVATESVDLDRVRALSIEVEVDAGDDEAALRSKLLDAFERARGADSAAGGDAAAAPPRAFVVEACLAGGSGVASDDAVLAGVRLACAERVPAVWWTQLRRGHGAVERGVIGTDPLRQALVGRSESLGAPLPRSAYLSRHFAPLLRVWEGEIDLGAQRELVRDAARLALAALDREPRA